jgi:hypothetical protein
LKQINIIHKTALLRDLSGLRPPKLATASEGGLFTKKFELFFKGSPSLRSGQARQAPPPACRAIFTDRLPASGGAFDLVKSRFEQAENLERFLLKENAKI